MSVDLHMHTSCSDGIYAPDQLTNMAVKARLSTIAISDHDTVSAYDETWHFNPAVRVIPAMEMSSEYDGEDVHILGFYIDPQSTAISDYCHSFQERRRQRALAMVDRCNDLGYKIEDTQVENMLDKEGTIGRPHIARMLIDSGYFLNTQVVFRELLYRGGPAYVPYTRCTIDECIKTIHAGGGIAVLAHPGLLKKNLKTILASPFDGLEVYHPDNLGREADFITIAQSRNWFISGGSDFHGMANRYPDLPGVFTFDTTLLQPLLEYR